MGTPSPKQCIDKCNIYNTVSTFKDERGPRCYAFGLSIHLPYADLFRLPLLSLDPDPFIRCGLLSLYHYIAISFIVVR